MYSGVIALIEVFPSETQDPRQALLHAESDVSNMEQVAIVYMRRGEMHPTLTCSSMMPVDLHFLGMALQMHAMKYLTE